MENNGYIDVKTITKHIRFDEKDMKEILTYVKMHKREVNNFSNLCRIAIFEYMDRHK